MTLSDAADFEIDGMPNPPEIIPPSTPPDATASPKVIPPRAPPPQQEAAPEADEPRSPVPQLSPPTQPEPAAQDFSPVRTAEESEANVAEANASQEGEEEVEI